MKINNSTIGLLSIFGLLTGCATTPVNTNLINNNFNSTLWVQTASEYKANAIQAYNSAKHNIEQAKKDVSWTSMLEQGSDFASLPVAIILDIDETVLDNSQYQAQLVLEGKQFDSEIWDQWVAMKSAPAIPGAVEFINNAESKGIEVIYITNRECKPRLGNSDVCPQKQDTIDNLKKIGINKSMARNFLLKKEKPQWSSEKKSRREEVAKNYRVIMLFGDDLGDFLPNVKKNITAKERDELVERYENNWGNKWFVLSNPTYGSWLRVLDTPKSKHLRGY